MSKEWITRLQVAIQKDGRSARAISLAAGFGPNYIQQFLRDGKEPGADKLARLLEVLGEQSSLFVLTGVEATAADLEMLRLSASLPPDIRDEALALFRALQARAAQQAPQPEDDPAEPAKS